jgi:hypothetical protein
LRRNLGIRTGSGRVAHHIVPSTSPRADAARAILNEYQIDINGVANGVSITEAQHRTAGLHRFPNIDRVTARLENARNGINDWAQARQAVIDELGAIRDEIVAGTFP